MSGKRLPSTGDWWYVLPAVSGVLAYVFFVIASARLDSWSAVTFYSFFAAASCTTVVLPAIAAVRGYDRVSLYLIGLLPSTGIAVAYGLNFTGGAGEALPAVVSFVLIVWVVTIPLVTLGFLLSDAWQHRRDLRERARHLLVPVVAATLYVFTVLSLLCFTDLLYTSAVH